MVTLDILVATVVVTTIVNLGVSFSISTKLSRIDKKLSETSKKVNINWVNISKIVEIFKAKFSSTPGKNIKLN